MRAVVLVAFAAALLFGYQDIDAKTFAKMMEQNDVVVLDVRTPDEFTQGHIAGANLIPIQLFGYIYLGGKGIKDKKILVYCRSGNRSVTAAKTLEAWGVKEVYNLKRGILEWREAGLPLVR